VLPDVISASPSQDAWAPTTTVCRLRLPVTSPATSAFPKRAIGRRTVTFRSSDFTAEGIFEVAAIPLCSGLSVCSPPWSLPPCKISYRADGDFYVRARHASFPPHAPDMLAVRHRQLTARGLSPRQTRSLVGCSALSSPTTCRLFRKHPPQGVSPAGLAISTS